MAEHIEKTLADVRDAIAKLEREVAQKKELANQLAKLGELELPYPHIEAAEEVGSAVIARDAFVGQPLHTAMRMYLDKRKVAMPSSAPATVNEIYKGLIDGGYAFDTKNNENAKRSIRIVIGKNTSVFHRVGDAYGLVSWYGPKLQKKTRKVATGGETADSGEPHDDEESVENEEVEEET
jgi:hypothetical protein